MQPSDQPRPAEATAARLSYSQCWRVWMGAAFAGWGCLALLVVIF